MASPLRKTLAWFLAPSLSKRLSQEAGQASMLELQGHELDRRFKL